MGACDRTERSVAWVFFEILLVLAIAVAIVWWTFPKKPRDGEGDL
jgi:hypothetical protein